ncbi:hypothetical protein [Brasilonema bromeliae]|uniref:hypothetical protein n=1 Tax=Brasilonema bromeliae TaxID=383615 RepID=UPI001B7D0DCC|nr:hypothetical protein [Brasilonema bromeliae]
MTNSQLNITTAISWCLAWGDKREPKFDVAVLLFSKLRVLPTIQAKDFLVILGFQKHPHGKEW